MFRTSAFVEFLCGAIAQLGERNTGSVEVGGSIPPSSTTFRFNAVNTELEISYHSD